MGQAAGSSGLPHDQMYILTGCHPGSRPQNGGRFALCLDGHPALCSPTFVAVFPSKLTDERGVHQLRLRPPCRWGFRGVALEQLLSDTFKLVQYLGICQCLAVRDLSPGQDGFDAQLDGLATTCHRHL